MSASGDCRHIRELAPELALGIVTGEERARALEHAGSCPACRKVLSELSDVADGLVALAPSQEPPVGFESRVMDRLARPPRRSWRRAVAALGAAALIAALAVAAVLQATAPERRLGAAYRETLRIANGEYLSAAVLRSPRGVEVGHVFGYQGSTSWVFVTVSDGARDGRYRLVLQSRRGSLPLGTVVVRGGAGSWGGALPGDFHGAEAVVLRARGHELHARF